MMETYWIYTNDGRRVGEFGISETAMIAGLELMGSEDEVIKARYQVACMGLRIDPTAHNFCVAAA